MLASTTRGLVSISVLPRPNADQATGRGEIHPRFPGEGVLMRHSSRPTNQCKGRSEPITENSSDAPRPTLRPARARRPRPTPRRAADGPRRRRPDVPGPDSTPGNGGSDRELPHNPVHHAGRGPADRTGGECAPGDPIPHQYPLRRHPPRHRRRPQALARPTCGCWRPSSTSPGPTPAAGPATTRSPPGSIATRGPSGGHYAAWRTSGTSVGNRPGRIPPVA